MKCPKCQTENLDASLSCEECWRGRGTALVLRSYSLGLALAFETVVQLYRNDADAQEGCAAATAALAREHGFPLWMSLGRVYSGMARVAKGDVAAIAEVMDGHP